MERVTRLVAAVPSGHGAKCDFRRAGNQQLSTGQSHSDGSSHRSTTKKKDHTSVWSFFFMERVTRLELATSTLARWRSTG